MSGFIKMFGHVPHFIRLRPHYTLCKEFENGALFEHLGFRSILIRQENTALISTSLYKPEKFEKAGFAF